MTLRPSQPRYDQAEIDDAFGEWLEVNACGQLSVHSPPWICTRRKDHDGKHIATDGESVIAEWYSDQATTSAMKRATMRRALEESLVVLAAMKLTEEKMPYAEHSPEMKFQINKAHDLVMAALKD